MTQANVTTHVPASLDAMPYAAVVQTILDMTKGEMEQGGTTRTRARLRSASIKRLHDDLKVKPRDIAKFLNISVQTVYNHLNKVKPDETGRVERIPAQRDKHARADKPMDTTSMSPMTLGILSQVLDQIRDHVEAGRTTEARDVITQTLEIIKQ